MAERKRKIQLTYLQVIALGSALAETYDTDIGMYRLGPDGKFWTDAAVAATQPFSVSPAMVARLRIQMFGAMKLPAEIDPLEARVLALEARLARLEGEWNTANLNHLFSAQESTK